MWYPYLIITKYIFPLTIKIFIVVVKIIVIGLGVTTLASIT